MIRLALVELDERVEDLEAVSAAVWRGDWSEHDDYNAGDIVQHDGSSWRASDAITASSPPDEPGVSSPTVWVLIAASASAGGLQLDEVSDVAIGSPLADGDVLTYDSNSETWVNRAPYQFYSRRIFSGSGSVTFSVNSTSYISTVALAFGHNMADFDFTHFRIMVSGASNAGGQTVTAQLATTSAPGTPMHTGGDDLVMTSAGALWDSGWRTMDSSPVGMTEFVIALKGSNTTVDLNSTFVDIHFKIDR